jgi:uncharacterized repeat protein (TIGR04138 family)
VATPDLKQKFEELLARDPRFSKDAYAVVQDAIKWAEAEHTKPDHSLRHVTARQILEALRDMARQECGGGARDCLAALGIKSSDDVGEIVYNLASIGAIATAANDSRTDFTGIFDFEREFELLGSDVWVRAWGIAVIASVLLFIVYAILKVVQATGR